MKKIIKFELKSDMGNINCPVGSKALGVRSVRGHVWLFMEAPATERNKENQFYYVLKGDSDLPGEDVKYIDTYSNGVGDIFHVYIAF